MIDGREMAEMTDSSLAYVEALIFIYARVSRSCVRLTSMSLPMLPFHPPPGKSLILLMLVKYFKSGF